MFASPAQQVGYDCLGNCLIDSDLDGICDEFEMAQIILQHDPLATDDDGSCIYSQIEGCTDVLACNYNSNATLEDSTCTYAQLDMTAIQIV